MSKKKHLLKGVGAAAMAVATLASGLSFGAAASAAPASSAPSATGAVQAHVIWHNPQTDFSTKAYVGLSGSDDTTTIYRTDSFHHAYYDVLHFAGLKQYDTLEAALAGTPLLTLPKPGTWGRILNGEQTCLTGQYEYDVDGQTHNSRHQGHWISGDRCTASSPSDNELFMIDSSGAIHSKLGGGLGFWKFMDSPYYGAPTEYRLGAMVINEALPIEGGDPAFPRGVSAKVVNLNAVDASARLEGTSEVGTDQVKIEWTDEDGKQRVKYVAPDAASGAWQFQLTGLKIGSNPVHLSALEGNEPMSEFDLDVTLTVAEVTASVTITEDRSERAHLSGKGEPGAMIEIGQGRDGALGSVKVGDDGTWAFDIDAPNHGGDYTLLINQTINGKPAGSANVNVAYGAGVTIADPEDGVEVDPDDPYLVLQGNGEKGAPLRVFEQGHRDTPLATGSVSATNGSYLLRTSELEDREYRLVVEQQGKGNNVTTAEVTVNPGKSSVANPTADVAFDADVAKKATVSGTGANGATITVKNGQKTIGTAKVVDGKWSTQIAPIGAGVHELTIEQTGIEGTQTTTATADFGSAVAITGPSGEIAPGMTTVTGTTQEGAKIAVSAGGKTVDATVNGTTWTAELEIAPSENPVTITAKQQSKGDLRTEATTTVTTTGAQQATDVTITTPASGTYKPGQTTTVAGTATAYAKVTIENQWGATLATRTADADGKWSFARQYGPAAKYTMTATQTRLDGTTSTSAEFTLAPENAFKKLTLTTPEATSTYLPGKGVLFTGTATPGATITATSSWGSTLFTTRANQTDGSWAATRSFGPSATYVITLTQTALDGTSDSISPVILTPPAHQDVVLTSPTQGAHYTPGQPVTFTGTASPGANIAIKSKLSGSTLTTTTADTQGKWSVKRGFGPTAVYNLDIIATATDGTTSSTELLNFGPAK